MDRVKFYSKQDWGCAENLEKLFEVLKKYDNNKNNYNINDIIEFYNIILYIDNECYLQNWSNDDIDRIKNQIQKIKEKVAKFCSRINNNNIINFFQSINNENYYYEDFFKLIDKYNVFQSISNEKIDELIKNSYVLELVLEHKKIVNRFGQVIKDKLLNYSENAIILIKKFEVSERNKIIYLPKELTNEDKEKLLLEYINSDSANLNYLRIIENIQSNKDTLVLSDKTRLLAKRRIKEQTQEFFQNNQGMKMETLVQFCHQKQEQEVKVEFNDRNIKCSYDLNWIIDNQDYPTLLNNFIYLFFYTDIQMRITLTSKKSNLGIFEKFIFIDSKNGYKKGIAFDRTSLLSDLQMMGYYERLRELNIRIESIIEWFFKNYLKDEFNIKDFRISIPSENSTFLEKSRTILSEIDHILKEYQLVVEEGKIDHELIEIASKHIHFKDIKTLVKNKYVYECSEEYKIIEHYFFSDQCMLKYNKRLNKNYKSFFELINKEKIKKVDYNKYAEYEINYLLKNGYISEDKDKFLIIQRKEEILIFKDLHENEVINYWKQPKFLRLKIDNLIDENILCARESLLSKPEIDYFNYYLNKSEFNNGLDLRNRYIHGTQPSSEDSEEENKHNYMIFLKLFILLIIKINDDLCIIDSDEYKKENK